MKCTNCGFENGENTAFCTNCGYALEANAAPAEYVSLNPVADRVLSMFKD